MRGEELVTINEIDERHRLAAQGMYDVPIIDKMSALDLRYKAAAQQRMPRIAFEPIDGLDHPPGLQSEFYVPGT